MVRAKVNPAALVDRLKILSDARQSFALIEEALRLDAPPSPVLGDWWGASFSVEGISDEGASSDGSHLQVDVVTARLIWPTVRAIIESEYHSLLDALKPAPVAAGQRRRRGRRR